MIHRAVMSLAVQAFLPKSKAKDLPGYAFALPSSGLSFSCSCFTGFPPRETGYN